MGESVKILVIEDDPSSWELVRRDLVRESNGRARFAHATNISEAAALWLIDTYDVVLLDLGLPPHQGAETLDAWREIDTTVPVVVLTGNDTDESAQEIAGKVGAYLTKSVDSRTLWRELVNQIFRGKTTYQVLGDDAESIRRVERASAELSARAAKSERPSEALATAEYAAAQGDMMVRVLATVTKIDANQLDMGRRIGRLESDVVELRQDQRKQQDSFHDIQIETVVDQAERARKQHEAELALRKEKLATVTKIALAIVSLIGALIAGRYGIPVSTP